MLLKDKVSKDIAARTPRWVGMSGVTPRSSLPVNMAVGVVVAELLDAYNCVHGQSQTPRVFILFFPAPFPGTFFSQFYLLVIFNLSSLLDSTPILSP